MVVFRIRLFSNKKNNVLFVDMSMTLLFPGNNDSIVFRNIFDAVKVLKAVKVSSIRSQSLNHVSIFANRRQDKLDLHGKRSNCSTTRQYTQDLANLSQLRRTQGLTKKQWHSGTKYASRSRPPA